MDFSVADQSDVPCLPLAEVLLEKHTFGIINMSEPGASIRGRLANDRVNWAGRRAQGVFNHKRLLVRVQKRLRLQAVPCDVRLRKGNLKIAAELPSEIPFALNAHALAGWT